VTISRDGLRDRIHTLEKPADVFRIAILGDSYAEALQVPVESAFWAVMEQTLSGLVRGPGKIEVINFGVSGYNTAQELLTLRDRVWQYNPDFVVLEFCSNDVKENSSHFNADPLTPYFVYQNGRLTLDSSFRESASYKFKQQWYGQVLYRVINFSRVLQVVNHAKRSLARRAHQLDQPIVDKRIIPTDGSLFRAPDDEQHAVAWRVTEDLTVKVRDEVVSRDVGFLVVSVSSPIQAHPDPSVREASLKIAQGQHLFYPDDRLAALGREHGFAVLTLGRPFGSYAKGQQVFLHGFANTDLGFGHWNVAGHRLAGQLIAEEISRGLAGE
jgi:hypothetical protein